jgi:hypothetical protein
VREPAGSPHGLVAMSLGAEPSTRSAPVPGACSPRKPASGWPSIRTRFGHPTSLSSRAIECPLRYDRIL